MLTVLVLTPGKGTASIAATLSAFSHFLQWPWIVFSMGNDLKVNVESISAPFFKRLLSAHWEAGV